MALSYTVAKGVLLGLLTSERPFLRTPKCKDRPALMRSLGMAVEESVILTLLLVAALAIALKYDLTRAETVLWLVVLTVQSLPYWATLAVSVVNAQPIRKYARECLTTGNREPGTVFGVIRRLGPRRRRARRPV